MDNEDYEKHQEIVRVAIRKQYEAGDKLAILDCILWCHNYRLPLPAWALSELATVAAKYLGPDDTYPTLDGALFGAGVRYGRTARHATERRENLKRQLIFDVVEALKRMGYQGEELWHTSQSTIAKVEFEITGALAYRKSPGKKVPSIGRIQNVHGEMRRAGTEPSALSNLIPTFVDIDPPAK